MATFTLVFLILFSSVFFSVILKPISASLTWVQEWFSELFWCLHFSNWWIDLTMGIFMCIWYSQQHWNIRHPELEGSQKPCAPPSFGRWTSKDQRERDSLRISQPLNGIQRIRSRYTKPCQCSIFFLWWTPCSCRNYPTWPFIQSWHFVTLPGGSS